MNVDFRNSLTTHLGSRNWSDICTLWIRALPSISIPGLQPASATEEFQPLLSASAVFNAIAPNQRGIPQIQTILGIREQVFIEAVYAIHKATNILSCAEKLVYEGKLTWPLTQAYQSAFFSINAIFGLCGISTIKTQHHKSLTNNQPTNTTLTIDIWPDAAQIMRSSGLFGAIPNDVQLIFSSGSIGHLQRWWLLKTVIARLSNTPWTASYTNSLSLLNDTDFEDQRNDLHYRTPSWYFGDLHNDTPASQHFGEVDTRPLNFLVYSQATRNSDFTLKLAITLVKMAMLLLEDIGQQANQLKNEISLLKSKLADNNRHPIYGNCIFV